MRWTVHHPRVGSQHRLLLVTLRSSESRLGGDVGGRLGGSAAVVADQACRDHPFGTELLCDEFGSAWRGRQENLIPRTHHSLHPRVILVEDVAAAVLTDVPEVVVVVSFGSAVEVTLNRARPFIAA